MDLQISLKEVLRYMGQVKEDPLTTEVAKEAITNIKHIINPNYTFTKVKKESLTLTGTDIHKHLENCSYVYILAATLGANLDRQIRLSQYKSMVYALALDSCATDAIEKLCDMAQGEIVQTELNLGNFVTNRYSPGYGDFPLDIQPTLIRLTNSDKTIGLTCTSTNILTPKKSVTALLGVSNSPVNGKDLGCEHCNLNTTCKLKKIGGLNHA